MSWGKLCGKVARSSVERLEEELVIPSGLDQKNQATRLCSTDFLVILSPDQKSYKSIKNIYFSFIKLTNSSVVKAGLYSQVIPNLSLQDPKTLNKIDALEALQIITPVPS